MAVVSLTGDFLGAGWSQVLAILAYNVGDLVGRGPLAAHRACPVGLAWLGLILRGVLVVLICLCVPPWPLSASPLPLVCLLTPFGVSAGYLTSSVMAATTMRVSEKDR